MSLTEYSCVEKWLEDLRLMTDTECMCVLQGKSLTKDTTDLVFTAARSTRGMSCVCVCVCVRERERIQIFHDRRKTTKMAQLITH